MSLININKQYYCIFKWKKKFRKIVKFQGYEKCEKGYEKCENSSHSLYSLQFLIFLRIISIIFKLN